MGSNPTIPTMKVFKVEVMVLDFDGVGEEGVKHLIENVRYPNRAISPTVHKMESREIQWRDNHPLNYLDKQDEAFRELFTEREPGGDQDSP